MIEGGDLRDIRLGGGDHFRVIGDTGGNDEDPEGGEDARGRGRS